MTDILSTVAAARLIKNPSGFNYNDMRTVFKIINKYAKVKGRLFVTKQDFEDFCKKNEIELQNETASNNIEPGR